MDVQLIAPWTGIGMVAIVNVVALLRVSHGRVKNDAQAEQALRNSVGSIEKQVGDGESGLVAIKRSVDAQKAACGVAMENVCGRVKGLERDRDRHEKRLEEMKSS